MTKSRSSSGSSTRRRQPSASSEAPLGEAPDILRHLRDIESRLNELAGDRLENPGSVSDSLAGPAIDLATRIEQILDRHAASIAEGLQQFQTHITANVVEAIQTAISCTDRQSTDPVAAANQDVVPTSEIFGKEQELPIPTTGDGTVDESWAMIRQAMLDTSADESESPTAAPEETELVHAAETEGSWEPPTPVDFTVPDPFDCDKIEDSALRSAFLEREEILRQLLARLRQRLHPVTAISTEQLREMAESIPDDLRKCVALSVQHSDEQLRLTELELSLERARMARQLTTMEETRNIVENTARRLGYSITEDGTLEGTPYAGDTRRSGGRWMRLLGFGR